MSLVNIQYPEQANLLRFLKDFLENPYLYGMVPAEFEWVDFYQLSPMGEKHE